MSSINYYENIQKYLFIYAAMLEQSNGVGLTDKAVHAENLFAHILNIIFKWSLKNANEGNVVQDSFDLRDLNDRVYVQVTANKNHRKKYNDTVASFQAQNQGQYSRLIILFIRPKVSPGIRRKVSMGNTTIELLDVPGLLKKILYACKNPAALAAINAALQHTIYPVIINFQGIDPLGFQAASIPLISERSKGFYIHRRELIKQIFDFIQEANGLLVGGPGFGKSFILEELKRHCLKFNIPCHIIKINEMVNGDNAEISEELKCNGDWLTALSIITPPQGSASKGVLIFDAFDTAKDERLKATILKQIRRAINDLQTWHILVSVRTYDASKSTRLLELFPNVNIRKAISCRNIEIPELSETELSAALQSLSEATAIESMIKPDLRKLLKTPYFLKIFEELLDVPNGLQVQNNIDSEAHLLNVFWRKKIDPSEENDIFLRRLTQLLSQNERLVCDKNEILNDANGLIFRGLISQGIIEEASVLRQRVSFTHNILLDYAISRYLLKDDAGLQVIYINSNEKQPFIFRQSFVYFYHELWQTERDLFWAHYHAISNVEKPLFRLFHQTILNFVLISVYQTPDDLKPLLTAGGENKAGQHIRKALEAIRFISGKDVRFKDVKFVTELAANMHWDYLWEVGMFIEKGIDFFESTNNRKALKMLSDASCDFLSYILNERLTFFNRPFLDGNGGYRGIKNLCDTFQFNKARSKALLLSVMKILDEEDFPITFFHTISEKILTIYENDRSLGIRLYSDLYAHIENSDKATQLGGSAIMALRSNRKQDYNMVHHRLEENYSKMMMLDYERAMPLGFKILNALGKDKYSYQEKISFPIKIGDLETVISTGYYYFDEDDRHGPFVHLKAIFSYLEMIAQPGTPSVKLKAAVLATLPHLKAGKFWGKMLRFLKDHYAQLSHISEQILSKPGIYQSEDTIYEAGELIKAIWHKLTAAKQRAIEAAIHQINTSISYYSKDSVENMKIRMLGCIPTEDLKLFDSITMLQAHAPISNEPKPYNGPTIAEARFHTKEERIQHAGFDLNKPVDAALYPFYEKVEAFNENYSKNESALIDTEEFRELLPAVLLIFEISEKGHYWNDQLKYSCDMEVVKFASHISSIEDLEATDKELIRKITLYYLETEVYISGIYHMGSNERSWIDLYPNARTQSVLPLYNLMLTDHALETYFLALMDDTSKHVRLKAIRSLNYFWHHDRSSFWQKVEDRINNEEDFLCLLEVLRVIHFDNILESNPEEIRSICTIMVKKLKEENDEKNRDLWQIFTIIILKLILRYDADFAIGLIIQNTDSKEFCRSLTFEITTIIDPHDPRNEKPDEKVANERLFETLIKITEGQFRSIKQKGLSSGDVSDQFEVIDHVIQHLYFVLSSGRGDNRKAKITDNEEREFFKKIRPIIDHIILESAEIDAGFMVAHTGYYFMQLMNHLLDLDPEYILKTSATIIEYSSKNNFTYDGTTLKEIVELTERIMADHKTLLLDKSSFNSLLLILDLFINSGWQEALELTWRLKEAF
jgi:hypothetical protein